MKSLFLAGALVAVSAFPGLAQQQIGAYYAELSPADMVNSSGVPLADFGAILQQDRANVHRFGIRQGGDDVDRFFGDRGMRALIPQLYASGPQDPLIARIVARERSSLAVLVFLCGGGGALRYLTVEFADGDGHRGC